MSEPVFKSSVIRYKATELADGMTKTLLQLWPAPDVPSSSTRLAVNQDIDDSEVDEPSIHSITEQFRDVYANALTLKADLLLTGKRFKAVFVQSNTPFNTRVMNKDGYTHHSYRQKNRIKGPSQTADTQTIGVSSETVKLCLFPAIYSIPLPQTPQDSSSDHNSKAVQRVMGYVNFDIADTGAVDSLPRLPISKAVVLSQYS